MHTTRVANFVVGALLLTAVAVGPGRAQPASPAFVFMNNNAHGSPNAISAFAVSNSGTLSAVGSSVATGGVGFGSVNLAANLIASNAAGTRLFVINGGDVTVSVFKVNRTTGRPKLLRRKPFNLYPAPQSATTLSIAATPDGRFVFIGDQSGAVIHALSVSKKGRMAAAPGSPFATPDFGYVIRMQVTFDGRLLAAALSGTQKFAVFRIGDDGALASPPGGADPGDSTAGAGISVAFSCAGDRLFAVQASLDRGPIVNVYDVADDGSLASVTGSPFSPGPTANPVYATTSADGGFLFVGYFGLGIASYRIAANGSLSMVAGSPFPLGADGFTRDGPCNFMPDASGRFLYAAAGGLGGIYTVRILNDGSMAALPGSPLQASGSTSIVVAPPAVCEELSIASQRFKTVHTLETRLERYRRNRIAPALVTAPN